MVGNDQKQSITLQINAEMDSLEQIKNLFGSIENNRNVSLGDGIDIRLVSVDNSMSFSGGAVVEMLVTFSMGVASSIVSSLIINAINKGLKKLSLNSKRTRVNQKSIEREIDSVKEKHQTLIDN